jgi:Zinc finger, C2H2 type
VRTQHCAQGLHGNCSSPLACSCECHHRDDQPAETFLCPDCPAVFFGPKSLELHARTHQETPPMPEDQFPCPRAGCNRAFETMRGLNHHLTSGHGEAPRATKKLTAGKARKRQTFHPTPENLFKPRDQAKPDVLLEHDLGQGVTITVSICTPNIFELDPDVRSTLFALIDDLKARIDA